MGTTETTLVPILLTILIALVTLFIFMFNGLKKDFKEFKAEIWKVINANTKSITEMDKGHGILCQKHEDKMSTIEHDTAKALKIAYDARDSVTETISKVGNKLHEFELAVSKIKH